MKNPHIENMLQHLFDLDDSAFFALQDHIESEKIIEWLFTDYQHNRVITAYDALGDFDTFVDCEIDNRLAEDYELANRCYQDDNELNAVKQAVYDDYYASDFDIKGQQLIFAIP